MSGKRQHFIPQFLQTGFASHTIGEAAFTWVCRKGVAPFNTNIINVGVEGFFYTDDDDTQVDDLITDAEGRFSELVHSLRLTKTSAVSDPHLPRLIAHLEVRTRHLRESFLRAGDFLMSRLLDFLSDERAFGDFLVRRLQSDPSVLREALSRELAGHGIPDTMVEPILSLVAPSLPAAMAQIQHDFRTLAEVLRADLPKRLKDSTKSGHLRALKKSVSPKARVQQYEGLRYAVVDTTEGDLILGDSPVLFHVHGSRPYKAFLDKGDVLKAIFLPLTPRKVLVGTSGGYSEPPRSLRQALARCSLEYFIAAEDSSANCLLKEQIGMDAHLITQEDLEEVITALIRE